MPDIIVEDLVNASPLHAWLSRTDWRVEELVRLLRGDEIVPASYARMEPHEWVEIALSNAGERPEFETELARRMAQLIDQEPEVNLCWPRPEQVLYNLLSVCASIYRPEELERPLRRMLERRKLEGARDGIELRGRLREALAGNQSNWDLQEIWTKMARGDVDFLPGNPFHAVSAILLMPMLDGTPPLEAIGSGVDAILPLLENHRDREEKLSRLIERAKRTYQAGVELVGYLLWQAYGNAWRTWARRVIASQLGLGGHLERFVLEYDQDVQRFLDSVPSPSELDRVQYAIKITAGIQAGLQHASRTRARRFAFMRVREFRKRNLPVPAPA